jgi:hypothetical protein
MMRQGENNVHTIMVLCAVAAVLVAFCSCSDYFTPWSAFQPTEYDLGSSSFLPDATLLSVPDSIESKAGQVRVVWYSFPANKDTTYVITFCPQFDNAVLDIFDSASQSSIESITDTATATPASAFWICRKSGTYYLRIRRDTVSYYYAVMPGPFWLSLKSFDAAYGAVADAYEPDSEKNLAARISFTSSNTNEVFQFHRLSVNDTDWYVFSPNYSRTYAIRTVGSADTKICVVSARGDSVVVSDDNSGGANNASLIWTCPYSPGFYTRWFYVTGGAPGASGTYGISVVEQTF